MRKHIVTLSRQFGSGGNEIGKELAKLLDIKFVDKAILAEAAEISGISKDMFIKADEKRPDSFLYSSVPSGSGLATHLNVEDVITEDKLFVYTANAIRKIAGEEPCLIVGRCADEILTDKEIVKIFIFAELSDRVKRISRLYEINEKAAAALIKKIDKKRSNYYNFYTGKVWGMAENYDLCINSSKLRKDGTIEAIKLFIDKFNNAE